MPIAKFQMPDGRIAKFEVPDGTTPEQAQSMISQNIDSLVPQENVKTSPQRSNLEKAVNLAGSFTQGRTLGLGPTIAAGIGSPLAKLALEGREMLGGPEAPSLGQLYARGKEMYSRPAEQAREDNPVLSALAELTGGVKSGLQIAGSAPAQAAGRVAGGYGLKGRAALGALGGELTSRAYEAGEAQPGEELAAITQPNPTMGGVLGAALPVGGSALSQLSKSLTPQIDDGAKAVAQLAQKYNIPIGLDDLSDSQFYKTIISAGEKLPFSGAPKKIQQQLSSFTKAAAKSIGLDDAVLTPENMEKAYKQIGGEFDALTKGKTFQVNDDVLGGLDEIREIAEAGGYGAEGSKALDKYLGDIYATINQTGTITGESLAKARSQLNKVARKGSDQNAVQLARELENVISDFITDGAPEALKKAKYKYKNFIALEPLAQKAQVDGFISPAQLSNRVSQVYRRQFTTGNAGELGDLARIGQLIKSKVPDSGTAQRSAATAALTGNIAGLLPTYAFGGPLAALGQLGLSGAALGANKAIQSRNYDPRILSRALNNNAMVPYAPNALNAIPTTSALESLMNQ